MPRLFHRTRLSRGGLCRAGLTVLVLWGAGCESWRTAQVDYPVLGPPPPRLSWTEEPVQESVKVADASGDETSTGYVQVSLSEPAPISEFAVMAIVNGEPILAGEILAPFQPHFFKMREQGATDRQVEQLKTAVIEKHLPQRIETALLIQSLRLMVKGDQLKMMEQELDKLFQKHLVEIMPQHKVTSKAELEKALAATGTSLAAYEQDFKNKQLAGLYLSTKTGERTPVIGRQDIVDYYEANAARYEHSAQARFQLLMTTSAANGGKDGARAKMETAYAELARGDAFGDVAMRHSDHPTAAKGGQHDWYKPGDFNSKAVDRALFELPVGEFSPIYEMPTGFAVVKVTERKPAGRTPLSEVQEQIRATLLEQSHRDAVESLLAELRENAVITTYVE